MPDLPPVVEQHLQSVCSKIEKMRRGGSKGEQKPHKLLMLLTVVRLADEGGLKENKVYFDGLLERYFEEQYRTYADRGDWCQPGPPFFHLRTSGLWNHEVKAGRESEYALLTTSGGGSKRIVENIEYAYLSDDTYQVPCNDTSREQLRTFLVSMLTENVSNRLKTSFHETFTLSRDALRQVLTALDSHVKPLRSATEREALLREQTHLGTRYVKAMPRYAVGSGLLDSDYALTAFGRAVVKWDVLIERPDTLWLLHYFLSAPKGPGPVFWHDLVTAELRAGNEFTTEDVEEAIARSAERADGRSLAARSINSAATIYLGTYTKDEALGRLGVLSAMQSGTSYRVLDSDPPSPWAFGYALLHYWQSQFGDQVTINMDELYRDGGLGPIFLCGAGRVNRLLATLQAEGFVDVFRVAPPYQIVLLRSDPQGLLQKMYGHDDAF